LKEYAYNEVPEKKVSAITRLGRKFWGITPWMLEITILLEWTLRKYFEVYVVMGLLVFNAILGFFQEERGNSALELLKEKLKINARVKRNGNWTLVPTIELVPGDVNRLRAGDFIPADVKVAEGDVEVDQLSLTGESQMVEKKENEILYGGSIVRRGEATGVVASTGAKTYFGRTAELLNKQAVVGSLLAMQYPSRSRSTFHVMGRMVRSPMFMRRRRPPVPVSILMFSRIMPYR
jgi:H+-transporting ATPase